MLAFCLAVPLVLGGLFRFLRAGGEDPGARRRGAALWVLLSLAAWAWAIQRGGRTFWLQAGVWFQTVLFVEVKVGQIFWAAIDGPFALIKRSVFHLRRGEAERSPGSQKSGMRA
ncbi:MAG: hypothetical protein ACYTKD_16070 [Planctomycetota bacterium]|jgi:hypothetical protein